MFALPNYGPSRRVNVHAWRGSIQSSMMVACVAQLNLDRRRGGPVPEPEGRQT